MLKLIDMKSKKFIIVLLLGIGFSSFAQFENKLNAVVFTGMPFYSQSTVDNPVENIFNDYSFIPYVGVGLDYAFNNHFSVGPNFRFLYAVKDGFSVPTSTAGLEFKYNIFPADKGISPFISGELTCHGLVSLKTKSRRVTQ